MNRRESLALLCAGLGLPVVVAAADAATALDGYLTGLSTWSADFTQQVQDSRGKQAESGRGRLVIVRPGRFRWEYAPEGADDGAQLMLADGRNLWFLDRDLAQAQVKSLQEAMPQSPFMLLAGGTDLRAAFSVQANGRRDGLEWVRVLPRDAQSDFREALFGFQGRELARIVVTDKVGQRSTLRFTGVKRNATVDPAQIRFELPAGVDLLGKPVAP